MNRGKRGFTLVELMIVLAIIAIIAAFAIPNLMKSRMSANETGAIGALRTLMTAQATYMNRSGRYGSLTELNGENLVDDSLVGGEKSGYYYGEITTGSNYAYTFGAIPADDGRSGEKEFIVNQQGTVYEAALTSTKASANIAWTAGSSGVPTEYTHTPESSASWTPIAE